MKEFKEQINGRIPLEDALEELDKEHKTSIASLARGLKKLAKKEKGTQDYGKTKEDTNKG